MSKFKNFLGIDVSKEDFDAVLILNNDDKSAIHRKFKNNKQGLNEALKWLLKHNSTSENTLICLEHTGVYGKIILKFFAQNLYDIWLEMALQIIKSSGLQRGKNDKVDALRIATYALKNHKDAELYQAPREIVVVLRKLLSSREKLMKYKTGLEADSKESMVYDKEVYDRVKDVMKSTLEAMKQDIQAIEKEMDQLIISDEALKALMKQIVSIPGVGKITATTLICYTDEFSRYHMPRQLACYAGVAPFEHSSGKSVRGKTRVHFMANKKLKKLLHMCAMSSINCKNGMRSYFDKKVGEGKNKQLVFNNIRNKIVHPICTCVRDKRCYEVRIAC